MYLWSEIFTWPCSVCHIRVCHIHLCHIHVCDSFHWKECSKDIILRGDECERQRTLSVAVEVLSIALRCTSPFMPYLSEELYQRLPCADKSPSICIAPYPSSSMVGLL